MIDGEFCVLGSSKVVKGVTLWQGVVPVANDTTDAEPIGEAPVFQSLGVSSLPYPKTAEGYAEGFGVRNAAGRSFAFLGARDTRTAEIVGKMEGGDTVVHTTDPSQSSQLQLKGKKRQAALTTKSSKKKTMMVLLDGKSDKVQITGLGAMIEIDKSGDISIVGKGGASILLQGNNIFLNGNVKLQGMLPGNCLMQGPPVPYVGGVTATTMTPVMGVGK